MDKNYYLKIAKWGAIGIIISILFYALFLYFGPLGFTKLAIVFNTDKLPKYVTSVAGLESAEKNLKTGRTYRRNSSWAAELKVKALKTFKNLSVKLKYENPNTKTVLIGIAKKGPFKYKEYVKHAAKIVENKLFDDLDWFKISDRDEGKILFQKGDDICLEKVEEAKAEGSVDAKSEYANCAVSFDEEENYLKDKNAKKGWVNYKYENVIGFIKNLPDIIQNEKVCYLNMDEIFDSYKIKDYSPATEINSFDYSFKGFNAIKTYIENEDFYFSLDYKDLNLLNEKSDFNIFVFKGDKMILEKNVVDDGNTEGNNKTSDVKNISITIPDLTAGQYTIYLDANDDTVFNSFLTKQKYWAFLNGLDLYENIGGIELYSNSGNITFKALRGSSLQTVTVEKEKGMHTESGSEFSRKDIKIDKLDRDYNFRRNIYSKIILEKADLNITFNYLLTPNMDSLLALQPTNLINFADFAKFNENACDYIISDYFENSKEKNGILTGSVDFNIADLYLDDENNFSFLLLFPGYNRNESGDVKIERIDLKYSR